MNLRTTTQLFVSLLILVFTSCHKPAATTKPSASTSSMYHITASYVIQPGVPYYADYYKFAFMSDAPAGSAVLWSFGDGTTSTTFAPEHIYTTLGTYTVTLTVGGDTANIATKVLDIAHSIMPHRIYCPNPWLKDSIMQFHSNVLPDSTFLWEFGDGSTSTDSTPSHAYASAGTYTVKLTVNGNIATACSTLVSIIAPPAHTTAMGGSRTWHDTAYTYLSTPATYVYPQPDQTFAISVINPVTIQFKGRTLAYSTAMSTDSTDIFYDSYTDGTGNNHDMTAYYYHYFDSIVVYKHDRVSAGGSTGERWTTP